MSLLLDKLKNRNAKILFGSLGCVFVFALFGGIWAVFGEQRQIVLSIDGAEVNYTTFKHTVGDFLSDENIILGENDTINLSLDEKIKDDTVIIIDRAKEVLIHADGETYHLSALDLTVGDALEQVDVLLDEDDTVTPTEDTPLTLGMEIQVNRIEVKEETRELELGYPVEKRRDASMSVHDEKVLQEGSVGKQLDTYLVTYRNGKIMAEKLLDSKVKDPITKIVVTGSYDVASRSGNQSEEISSVAEASQEGTSDEKYAPNGMKYKTMLTAKATAYTHDGSKTKMGTECRVGAIAVDPSVIPLGSKLYVEGYGYCTAEDTGGKIKGNRIDVFLDSESECVSWGVKTVTVYVLE